MIYGKLFRPLAFLLIFALCVAFSFALVSPVMAAEIETYLYNGVELPDINTVWTDKSNYPCAVLYQRSDGFTALMVYASVAGYSPSGDLIYYGPYVRYKLNGGIWEHTSTQASTIGFSTTLTPFWTNVDITRTDGSGLFLAATDPVPVISGPTVDSVTLSASSSAPYYPGTDIQLNVEVVGTGIDPGSPESTLYWYVHGNTSENTYIEGDPYSDVTLHIGNDETATSLEIEAISTYDTTKSATLELPVTYPLEGVQIIPSGQQQFVQSDKQRTIQYQLLLPNGDPYDYQLLAWIANPTPGHENYFTINNAGLLTIAPDAPVGSGCTIQFAYQSDTSALSPVGASVQIISQLDGVIDGITPTPEQSDKADQMEDAIGDAAGKLENNNSSLGDLTPTRPQVDTDLQLDQDCLLAVSPLVTNIWSINGLGRMISIVLVVATVAYVFFGKRDG